VAVVADSCGLTLRNLVRTRHAAWSDLDSVLRTTDDSGRYVRIVLQDGRQLRCAGLAGDVSKAAHG
jgi:hypothetical protein